MASNYIEALRITKELEKKAKKKRNTETPKDVPLPPPPPPEDKNVEKIEPGTTDFYELERSGKGKLINAKCPNCGAMLELPEKLDRAFCQFCGGKVIISRDVHYHSEDSLFSHKLKEINKLKKKRHKLILKRNNEMKKIENELANLERNETQRINGIKKEVKQNVIGFFLFVLILGFIFGFHTMAFADHEPICQGIGIIITTIFGIIFFYIVSISMVDDYAKGKVNKMEMNFQTKRTEILAPIKPIESEIYRINNRLGISGFDLNEEVDVEAYKLKI